MSLSAQLNVQYSASELGEHTVAQPVFEPRIQAPLSFETGVGENQADMQWVVSRTLQASASETIDLGGGTMLDAFGQPIVFGELVGIVLVADKTNLADIVLGGGTDGWFGAMGAPTDKMRLKPGGFLAFGAPQDSGLGVVATGADKITITNEGVGSIGGYSIVILGRSA